MEYTPFCSHERHQECNNELRRVVFWGGMLGNLHSSENSVQFGSNGKSFEVPGVRKGVNSENGNRHTAFTDHRYADLQRLRRLQLLKQPDMVFVGEIIHLCTRALPEERPKAEVIMSALEIGMASEERDYRGRVQESDEGETLEYETGIQSTKAVWQAGGETKSLVRRFEKNAKDLSQVSVAVLSWDQSGCVGSSERRRLTQILNVALVCRCGKWAKAILEKSFEPFSQNHRCHQPQWQ